jgi:hypothetical protein
MRRSAECLFVLLGAAAAAFGLDLTTFRQSYSRASRANWTLQSSLGTVDEFGRRAQQYGSLLAGADWRTAILSDGFDFDADMAAYAVGGAQNSDAPDTLPEPRHDVSAGLALNPTATCHYYLFGTDAFVRAGLDARGDIALRDVREGTERDKRRLLGLDLRNAELGVGYGRMRDAWPLYRAARLTRILKEEGVLVRELSDDDLRDLGGFLSRAWKLFYAHERAAKFYYDSLEQWLMHAGAIREPLPAYALFRLDETPLIGLDTRRFGMRGFFTANVQARRQSQSYDLTDTAWTELDTSSSRSFQVGCEFSGLRGLRWSYGASAAYVLPWPALPDSGMRHQLVLAGSASYDITDRLVASYGLDLQPFHQAPASPGGTAHISLPSEQTLMFSYYLSERFAVRLGGRYGTEFDHHYGTHYRRTDFHHRWSAVLTMTFGRIPSGWGVHYYL